MNNKKKKLFKFLTPWSKERKEFKFITPNLFNKVKKGDYILQEEDTVRPSIIPILILIILIPINMFITKSLENLHWVYILLLRIPFLIIFPLSMKIRIKEKKK